MYLMYNYCSFSFAKLIHNYSKLFSVNISNPNISRISIEEVEEEGEEAVELDYLSGLVC
jgi:hypothetical protein